MSLRVYNRKRNFAQTPEPKGKKSARPSGGLRFVVQMHAASRLHFDFRLEFDGVFKSWAVPKGPSLNPQDQRLAVFVEDHPLDYGSFEGIIPPGNYGAGTVMVWDEGTYIERGSENRQQSEAAMKKNFAKGHLTFVLDGQKLKGEFALIQLKKDRSENAWLLVKKRDEFSTYKRSDKPNDLSVKTGRTMEKIAAEAERKGDVWLPKKGRKSPAASARKPKKSPLPRKLKPMIATLHKGPPPKDWWSEANVNGVRAIAEVEGAKVSLYSKAGLPFNKKYPAIVDELKALNVTAVFDGEISDSKYFIYDLLYWVDRDLRQEDLRTRKKLLQMAFKDGLRVRHLPSKSVEHIIAKNPLSPYKSGTTSEWKLIETKTQRTPATPSDQPRLTNLKKIYFPEDGITKGDLIEYYKSVSPYILPYLKDRPESLNRQPNGIDRPGFFQKDMIGYRPRWLKTERIFSESAGKTIDYLLCQDEPSLLYMINLGCIELNPWLSRVGQLERPDFLVIDLDPDGNSFEQVIAIAKEVHHILTDIGAANFCKTSGATGLHIGIPLEAQYDYDPARVLAEKVCQVVARRYPQITSIERNPNRRRNKIYLDFLQNRRGQTLAAPFCVRPKPQAPVSMPLHWPELKKNLKPEQFTLHNALQRIAHFHDPWQGVLGPGINLERCIKALQRKYAKD